MRYHSLIADPVPDDLDATARTPDGLLMAVAHRHRPLWGVQFHPESIGTAHGAQLLANFRDATPPRNPITVTAPAEPEPTPEPASRYVLASRRLPLHPDPSAVYEALFAAGPHGFWLDGSAALDPQSRFTVLGNGAGHVPTI